MNPLSIAITAAALLAPVAAVAQALTWGQPDSQLRYVPRHCQVALSNMSAREPWTQAGCDLVVFTTSASSRNVHFHMNRGRGRERIVSFVLPLTSRSASLHEVVGVGFSSAAVDARSAFGVREVTDPRANSCEARGQRLVCSALFREGNTVHGVVAAATLQ
jgi:hypothetical protein